MPTVCMIGLLLSTPRWLFSRLSKPRWWKWCPLCEIKRWEGVKEKVAYAFRNFDQSASKHIDITKLALNNDWRVLTSFKRPVCPQTDAVRLLLNRAMKHLYLFVIDTGVAVLHKYEVGETLWSKVMWPYQWLYAPICIWYFTGTYFAPVSHYTLT